MLMATAASFHKLNQFKSALMFTWWTSLTMYELEASPDSFAPGKSKVLVLNVNSYFLN